MGIPRTVLCNIFSLGLVCDLFAFTVHYFYRAHDHLRNLEVSLLPDQVFSSRQRQDSPQLLSGRHVSLTWTHPLVHLHRWAQTCSCLHGDTPHRHTHCAHITWVYTSGHRAPVHTGLQTHKCTYSAHNTERPAGVCCNFAAFNSNCPWLPTHPGASALYNLGVASLC